MEEEIKGVYISHKANLIMPDICCACGSSSLGKHKLKISDQIKKGPGWTTSKTIYLPLCDTCHAIRRSRMSARTIGGLIGLVITVAIIALIYQISGPSESGWFICVIPAAIFLIIMGTSIYFSDKVTRRNQSFEKIRLGDKLADGKIARIQLTQGDLMAIVFNNVDFANEFQI
jgi:hypothetical protein